MKLFLKTGVFALLTSFIFGIQGSITLSDAKAAWKPRKPVEFVIMAGKGGGADRLARCGLCLLNCVKVLFRPLVNLRFNKTPKDLNEGKM